MTDAGIRFLYIGLNHSVGGSRLFYRQMPAVRSERPDVKLYFLASKYKADFGSEDDLPTSLDVEIVKPPASTVNPSTNRDWSTYGRIERSLRFRWNRLREKWRFWTWKYREMLRIRPDVVQASDARELPYAVILMWLVGYTLIYDSHEDYFNQVYEYRGKTWKALFEALWLSAKEFVFARFCDRVFVTSAAHQEKYERTLYGVNTAHLLPNFTPNWLSLPEPPYKASSTLRLVYVGTVNRYRGVLEVAKFSRRFNQQHQRRTLQFHYIGVSHPLVDELESQGLIVNEGAFSFPIMMEKLQRYNVGVCLLHDIKKFRTSVPIKNFDYMAAGLPVLTSNFGEMKRYVSEAGAGICIDPVDYEEFEEAILRLFDPAVRKRLGQAGQAYTRGPGSFDRYAEPYLDAIPDPE